MKKIHLICAARPNFMKVAPLYHSLKDENWCKVQLVHTGQHYDPLLSEIFFEQLKLPIPDFYLGIGSGSHAEQAGNTMIAYERLCAQQKPDLVIVFGDVNATLACAIAAKKLLIPVVHVEAGLRSFDMTMPEEINRIVVDRISDLHFTPSDDADDNLKKEGISINSIKNVGNIMIDSFEMLRSTIESCKILEEMQLQEKNYAILTLHRPINVDDHKILEQILCAFDGSIKIIFPVHPRTKNILEKHQINLIGKKIKFIDPLPYVSFMRLVIGAKFVVTDSGGLQEETSYLGIPCLTLRKNTERPVTITHGTNQLISINMLNQQMKEIDLLKVNHNSIPLWDGNTAKRIVTILKDFLDTNT